MAKIILFIENSTGLTNKQTKTRVSTKTLLKYSCKIQNQNIVAFLYTNNELFEQEFKKTISFITASERITFKK